MEINAYSAITVYDTVNPKPLQMISLILLRTDSGFWPLNIRNSQCPIFSFERMIIDNPMFLREKGGILHVTTEQSY